jgi:hypothetical protein
MWRQVIQQLQQRSTPRPMSLAWSVPASCQASTRVKPLKALPILLAFLICKVRHLFTYAFNVTPVLQEAFIQFRVYAESPEAAHTLLDAWIATLGNTLTVTGFTTEWCAVANDLPPTDQLITGRYIYGRGTLIEISTE